MSCWDAMKDDLCDENCASCPVRREESNFVDAARTDKYVG